MPTYEYVCEKCGHEFEQFQSIAEAPLSVCPREACTRKKWGRGRVRRKIGAGAGLLFKGSGFYITDYRSESYRQAAKKEAEAAKPSGDGKASGEGSKSESRKAERSGGAAKK
ncbi:MAG: zinc ribbon domain-containing protein [Verrucomicrobiae bacterium]|nr:zinc ribbon domain-containing protein [Verrucomicrobiae bacterium]MDW8308825.1 zinc ribbon domain-containing protein [Verrucomicrobiales bacterium]